MEESRKLDSGVPGGNKTQRFVPRSNVFHAEVPSGSMCTLLNKINECKWFE
jgi:hypothetical protein